jgi:hypothetical protein
VGFVVDGVSLTEPRPVAAVHVVQVVAVLREELGVAGVEGEAVAARLELGNGAVALEVLVARVRVRVEAVVVRALEALLGQGCNRTRSLWDRTSPAVTRQPARRWL